MKDGEGVTPACEWCGEPTERRRVIPWPLGARTDPRRTRDTRGRPADRTVMWVCLKCHSILEGARQEARR